MAPVLLFELSRAVTVSIIWGILVLTLISYLMAKDQKVNPAKVIFEHLLIAVAVIFITKLLGDFIAIYFK